jgi:hypothetical protein
MKSWDFTSATLTNLLFLVTKNGVLVVTFNYVLPLKDLGDFLLVISWPVKVSLCIKDF